MNNFITPPSFPTAKPAQAAAVTVSLTTLFIVFYGFLFLIVYLQLVAIWYYKHKRFSYQTVFLFQSLIWSTLRIILFSFYYKNAEDANKLSFFFYFLLYCCPVIIQFSLLCLLVLYYGQVYFKIATREKRDRNKLILRSSIIACTTIFIFSSIFAAFYTRELCLYNTSPNCHLFQITAIRIALNDSLFVIFGFLLSTYLFKLARLSMKYVIPEQDNISVLKAMIVSIFTSFLLLTRTFYNLLAVSVVDLPDFGFDWINVSDQADLVNLTETKKYITFTVVLLIWEIIPTFVIIVLFRLRRSSLNLVTSNDLSNYSSYGTGKSVFLESKDRADSNLSNGDDDASLNSYDQNNNFIRTSNMNINNTYDDSDNENPSLINSYTKSYRPNIVEYGSF